MSATQYIETLNEVGRALSQLSGKRSGWPQVACALRATLKLDAASIWTLDRRVGLLVHETFDAEAGGDPRLPRIDEDLTQWQLRERTPRVLRPRGPAGERLPLPPQFQSGAVSLPLESDGAHLTVLNLYATPTGGWYFDAGSPADAAEFFRSVGGQVEFFMRQKALEANATFYKEMHHRVKNNLQTVSSLLRMQVRRLDRQSAERALEDAIARIETIALVHETLSEGQVGLVDLGELLQRIAALAGEASDAASRITLRLEGPRNLVGSRQATSLALLANELVQNALRHGDARPGNLVEVRLERCEPAGGGEARVRLTVLNAGLLPAGGPDVVASGNLGLTIVRNLTDELSGDFVLESRAGHTFASVSFPAGSLEPATDPSPGR